MGLDVKKLENVSTKFDGKVTARCPACAKEGNDRKGEHLVVFPDGKFGCVKYEKDAEHRKVIQSLAGNGKRQAHIPSKLTVRPFTVPKSSTLMNLGSYPQFSQNLRRQWPAVNKPKQQEPEGQVEGARQMEFAFMDDFHNRPKLELGEFTNDISRFNVPPKPTISTYPALPPNPMRDRV